MTERSPLAVPVTERSPLAAPETRDPTQKARREARFQAAVRRAERTIEADPPFTDEQVEILRAIFASAPRARDAG